jgi:hypothetical protein
MLVGGKGLPPFLSCRASAAMRRSAGITPGCELYRTRELANPADTSSWVRMDGMMRQEVKLKSSPTRSLLVAKTALPKRTDSQPDPH